LDHGYFERIQACFHAWDPIVAEWRARGGRFDLDVDAMRMHIAQDQESAFSAAIRKVWKRGLDLSIGNSSHALENQSTELVESQLFVILEDGVEDYIGKDCSSVIWLSPLIWEDLAEDDVVEAPTGFPATEEWGSRTAPRWVLASLLMARIDESGPNVPAIESPRRTAAEHIQASDYAYVNIESGSPLLLSDSGLSSHAWAASADTCGSDGDFICLYLREASLGFAVPREPPVESMEWEHRAIRYCLVDRWRDGESNAGLIMVVSIDAANGACEQGAPIKNRFIYSYRHGLRYLDQKSGDGPHYHMYAVREQGWGAAVPP
jgi:hypothetical protein